MPTILLNAVGRGVLSWLTVNVAGLPSQRGRKSGNNPLADGMPLATVQARRHGKPLSALWADGLRLKCVESLVAQVANPKVSRGRRCRALRTGEFIVARCLRYTR